MTKTISKKLKIGIVAICVVLLVLVALIILFNVLNKTKKVNIDGDTYVIKEDNGGYTILFDEKELEKTSDDYYLLKSGNLLSFDTKSGEYKVYAHIDSEKTEELYNGGRVLVFPYQSNSNIKSLSVENQNGNFTVEQNGNSIVIKDSTATILSGEGISQLMTVAGYPLGLKLDKNETVALHGYKEYGLENPKAKYILTNMDNERFGIEIGDKTPDGFGYYARYSLDNREAVYILTATDYIESYLLSGVESICAPILAPNLGYNMYLNVQNCALNKLSYDESGNLSKTKNILYCTYLSKINGVDRLKTEYKSQSFFGLSDFAVYTPSADAINEMLYNLYSIEPLYVADLGTDNLSKFGLDKPKTTLYYENSFTLSGIETNNRVFISFSDKNEDGIVYAYSKVESCRPGIDTSYKQDMTYNQVVALDANTVDFLNFTKANFVSSNYFSLFFDYLSKISMKFDGKEYLIEVTHSNDGKDYEIVAIDDTGKRYILSKDKVKYENKYMQVKTADSTNALFDDLYIMLLSSSIIGEHGLDGSEIAELKNDGNKLLEFTVTTTSGRIMSYRYYALSDVRSLICLGAEKTPGSRDYVEASDFYCYTARIDKIKEDFRKFFLALSYYETGDFEAYDSIEISGR